MSAVVELHEVAKSYRQADHEVPALRSVDLSIDPGVLLAVHGRSGSGKTTLLNIIGGLDRADRGSIVVCGTDMMTAADTEVTALRRTRLAFVFQGFGLLPVLSAAENVEVPLRLQKVSRDMRAERVAELLDLVGLSGRAHHRPHELSGGEQQRVAIARALAVSPDVLIADEPTGQLDSRTGAEITALIARLARERSMAVVLATHDRTIITGADVSVALVDGHTVASA